MFNTDQYYKLRDIHVRSILNKKLRSEIKDHLKDVINYLELYGKRMPASKYKFNYADLTTWKYLDSYCRLNESTGDWYYKETLNPTFKYEEKLNDD